jgi:hypothetical protein
VGVHGIFRVKVGMALVNILESLCPGTVDCVWDNNVSLHVSYELGIITQAMCHSQGQHLSQTQLTCKETVNPIDIPDCQDRLTRATPQVSLPVHPLITLTIRTNLTRVIPPITLNT